MTTKKKRLANQLTQLINSKLEKQLKSEIQLFFQKQMDEVLSAFDEYYTDTLLLQGHINLILSPIHELQKEYYDLLLKYNTEIYNRGKEQGRRQVEGMALKSAKPLKWHHDENKPTDLFGTLPTSEQHLTSYTFTASESTMNRVDGEINRILTEGYRDGLGVKDVRNRIMERYQQFTGWEANRIARTEMQTAHNMGVMQTYQEMGVQYKEWRSAHDKRTRRSHSLLDGEVAPLDKPFSNGLMYPGDKSGPIEEWINCRCSFPPFIMPPGMMAPPGMAQFRVGDLVSVSEPDYDQLLRKETGGAIGWEEYSQILQGKSLEQVLAGVTVAQEDVNNDLLKGGHKEVYTDVDPGGHRVTVYKYDNIELAFNENTRITHKDLRKHINSLPKQFEQTQAKRIYIHDYADPNVGGMWYSDRKTLHVYDSRKSLEGIYDMFNHEFSHSLDMFWIDESIKAKYSDSKIYQKIFDADNKLGYSELGMINPEVPIKFVSSYAGRSYLKYYKLGLKKETKWAMKKLFAEDFAESSRLYLNPNKHNAFVKEYPNRAKYLESIYGKPNFKNSGIKPVSKQSPEQKKLRHEDISWEDVIKQDEVKEWEKEGYRNLKNEYDTRVSQLDVEIEQLRSKRREYTKEKRKCETEECYEKWDSKVRETRVERKRLEKVRAELSDKSHDAFMKIYN